MVSLGLGETYFQMAKLNAQTSNDNKYLNHMELSISVIDDLQDLNFWAFY